MHRSPALLPRHGRHCLRLRTERRCGQGGAEFGVECVGPAAAALLSLPVFTSSDPHPDGAELVGSDAGRTFCYTGRGAAFNDINGHEADETGMHPEGTKDIHVVYTGEDETTAAKRPATMGGWPMKPNPNSPIVWRPVSSMKIGSPFVATGGGRP